MPDTYVSHPVRRLREDPIADEDVTLVLDVADAETADAAALDRVAAAVRELGTVDERLQFGSLEVTVPQDRLDDVCSLDGIASIETAQTRSMGGDAGEDVRPGE
jgi:hypothetical protein